MNLALAAILWPVAGVVAATTATAATGDGASTAGEMNAGNAGPSMFSVGGFGTFGVVHSSEDRADFTAMVFQPSGAGYTRRWSAAVDSLIGAQVTVTLSAKAAADLQVISQQNYDRTFTPHVEWANIKYQLTPDLAIRVGRTALPVFMVTDSRWVGYANPWVRPPSEVYNLASVTVNDGVDASYRWTIAAATNTLQMSVGQSNERFAATPAYPSGTVRVRQQLALVDSIEHGFAKVRFNYGQARVTAPEFKALFDAFRQFGSQGEVIADQYDIHGRLVTFFGIGASYDPADWFVIGEWGHVNTRSILGDNTGWYATGGYHLDHWTPYVTYGQMRTQSNMHDPGLDVSALPAYLAASASTLNAALSSGLRSIPVQKTISFGARWDFVKNFDAKLQVERTGLGTGSPGTLRNLQPGFEPGGTVTLFTVTMDFVF